MKPIRFHRKLEKEMESMDAFTRFKVTELLTLLAKGESLGMPVSRPIPVIAQGSHELRVKDATGQYRIFYFVKFRKAFLVFHFFKKENPRNTKTQN